MTRFREDIFMKTPEDIRQSVIDFYKKEYGNNPREPGYYINNIKFSEQEFLHAPNTASKLIIGRPFIARMGEIFL